MASLKSDAGSFRDPGGRIYILDKRVLRTVMPVAAKQYEYVRLSGLFEELIERGWLVPLKQLEPEDIAGLPDDARYILEHPKLDFISYPYEWSFSALKNAALRHLDIQMLALDYDVALSDASAYNIQFEGPNPIFIDHLSFRQYKEGEFWLGHKQFCEQFLNPLLLRSLFGLEHNAWYRGTLEGIPAKDISKLLPWRKKLSVNVLTHVVMQARLQAAPSGQTNAEKTVNSKKLPKNGFKHLLRSLRSWISKLEPKITNKTVWADYATDNSYSSEEAKKKRAFITEFSKSTKPKILWDLGCNTGEYSKIALQAGAEKAIGFDFDQMAIDVGFRQAKQESRNFFPVFFDAANPAPNQGWRQQERLGMYERASADGVLALALVHHLAIARNIPLRDVIAWVISLAPVGIIEFVPKSDPMVKTLLGLREDIFEQYNRETFHQAVESLCRIERHEVISQSGRELFWYQRV